MTRTPDRKGITDPALLFISKQSVLECDAERVYKNVRLLMATREDAMLYREQVSVVFEGWDDDPRELVDVPEVRAFVKAMAARWPEWLFYFNQLDPSIALWMSCQIGRSYPGGGAVEIDAGLLGTVLTAAFDGMNAVYDRFHLSESDLEAQSQGVLNYIADLTGRS